MTLPVDKSYPVWGAVEENTEPDIFPHPNLFKPGLLLADPNRTEQGLFLENGDMNEMYIFFLKFFIRNRCSGIEYKCR